LSDDGVQVLTNHKALKVEKRGSDQQLICQYGDQQVNMGFDKILVAVGRTANTAGLGLEHLGIELTDRGTIAVNDYLQTSLPTVYACGDVAGPYQFTHTAAHQAWYATVNSLFSGIKRFAVDYSVIPWCTFTDPEVARVGLNEQEAKAQGIAYEVSMFPMDDLDRAIAEEATKGFIKVLTVPGKDKILGVTLVGHHAGDWIAEYVQAMKWGIGLNKILSTIHIYPTFAEVNKMVAGRWKQAHAPAWALALLGKWHGWRR
jgi:pyruvate/2-oxoglutarate dehydrogenase complex dihydrolipoamide dehydrogenase (E3) component